MRLDGTVSVRGRYSARMPAPTALSTAAPPLPNAPALPRSGTTAYRVDLDGLRGFAIALVVIFHVFVGRVSGGVDVFLFLSGYFFLGGQLRYAQRPFPSLNPWWPLWRAIRRLVPALVFVLALTLLAARAFAPQLLGGDLYRQLSASLRYTQNFELIAQNADYAAASDTTSPLQHLWSMSVQGQFYLFAIALGTLVAWLVSTSRATKETARRVSAAVLATISLASFAYASRFGLEGTPSNYYSTFARAWELCLGALLALVPHTWRVPRPLSWLLALVGLAMVTVTGFVIPSPLAFPGPLALLPVAGAACVILAGNANPVSTVLASKPMTWLGTVAYSLYLWHWPLLIIATAAGGFTAPPPALGLAVIAVSLLLAQFTYVLVEEPLQQHRPRPRSFEHPLADARAALHTLTGAARAAGGGIIAVLFAAGLAVQPAWQHRLAEADVPLDPAIYPGAMALVDAQMLDAPPQPDPRLVGDLYPPITGDGCLIFRGDDADALPPADCVYGDQAADTTVVLAGGSHIEPFIIPLDALGKEHGFKVLPFVRQDCPLVIGGDGVADIVSDDCAAWGEMVYDDIVAAAPNLVISTSTRPTGRAGAASAAGDVVPAAYAHLWARLADAGIAFLGLRDNPWFFDAEGAPLGPNNCIVAGGSVAECSMPATLAYPLPDPAASVLNGSRNLFGVDTAGWYCPGETCPPVIGNVYVYRDQHHISNAYARSLAPLLWGELVPIFNQLGLAYR